MEFWIITAPIELTVCIDKVVIVAVFALMAVRSALAYWRIPK